MFGKKEEKRVAAKPEHAESRKPAQDDQPKTLLDEDLATIAGGYPMPFTGSASLPRPLD